MIRSIAHTTSSNEETFANTTAMSSSANLAVGHQHAYTGLLGALADIYRTEGIKGYWRGVNVFIPRVVAYRYGVGAQCARVFDALREIRFDFE